MAFQLTRLNVPNLTTDYGNPQQSIANIGTAFTNALDAGRKQQEADQKKTLLASLGQAGTDYNKVGLGLIALGDTQGGAALLGLGEKAKERQLQEDAYKSSPFSSGGLGASAARPSAAPQSLIQNESSGNFQAQNSAVGAGGQVGHFGRLQFGQARLQEAAAAGAIPQGTTPQQFMASPDLQKSAEAWHFNDIDQAIKQNGYDQLVGKATIGGVPVTVEGLRAVAHLGGKEGMRKFVETQGAYNPQDENGTKLSDYFARHGGGGGQPAQTQVAQAPAGVPQSGGTYANVPPERLQQFIDNPRVPENLRTLMRQELAGRQGSQPAAAPVQLAQAPAQPGQPVADVPAQGATPAGFNVPGSGMPPNDPAPNISNQQLLAIQANPRLASQHDIAKQILANRQKYTDENAPDKREQQRLTTEKLRREVEGEGGRPMTADERKSFGVREGQPAFIKKNGDPGFGPAGTSITNANTFDGKGESKFNEALGTAQAKRWNGYIEEGDVAQGRIADIQTLRDASRRLGSQGSSANLKATIGPFAESLGIKIEGLPDIQLYESIANRLAPQMRAPGSGSTSDIEFKGFMRAIGPLSNTPAAREMIFDTFEAASRNDLARSEIASRLAEGQISRGQAEKEIRALPSPLEGYRKFREANPDAVGQAIKESAMTQAAQKRDPVKVTSPDEARKLPSGTRIILPDGRPGVVP